MGVSGEVCGGGQAQVHTFVSEGVLGWRGRVEEAFGTGVAGTRMGGVSGVGRRRWAGPRGLYGTGLQHDARDRAARLLAF